VGARTDSWKAWLTSSAKANLQPLPPYATAQTPVLDSVARTEIGRIVRVTDSGGRITLGGLRSIDRDTLTIAEPALTLRQIDERAGKLFEMRARRADSRLDATERLENSPAVVDLPGRFHDTAVTRYGVSLAQPRYTVVPCNSSGRP
jgi:hypothetical protein